MRKIMNDPKSFVDDFLDGLLKAYPSDFRVVSGARRALIRVEPPDAGPKVAIVTGGGSGHLPLFLGYVGQGLCSAAAVGNTFSSPSADSILAATKASESGKGVLFLYGNYSGDGINFDDAAELAADNGIETVTVRAADDVASAPNTFKTSRRGVAGLTLAYKCAGAAAAADYSLSETAAVATRALLNTRTMGVGLSPTIIPEAGRPTFELAEDEMELGIGIHGEPGIRRERIGDANRIADLLLDAILARARADCVEPRGCACQQPRGDPSRRALHRLRTGRGPADDRRRRRSSCPCGQVCDESRDGRLLRVGDGARRRAHLAP